MYFGFNIAVYEDESQNIKQAIINIMQDKDFYFVESDQIKQSLSISDETLRYHHIDDQFMVRKFFIAPKKNNWNMVYPTGWFSETQDLSVELSRILGCVTMTLLVDDSRGWGYQLAAEGQIIDKYHTHPLHTPTLQEKSDVGILQEEIEEEDYIGNPSIIAATFNVDKDQVSSYLTTRENPLKRRSAHKKMSSFFKLLNIPDGDGAYGWYEDLQDRNDRDWDHLIFARRLTSVELQWRQKWKVDSPFLLPPIWLNENKI